MDDGRNFPLVPSHEDEETGASSGDSTSQVPNADALQKPLTHRPRGQTRLTREYLQSLSSDAPAHTSAEPASSELASREFADLQPFAEQLIAIADQLRAGAFGPDRLPENAVSGAKGTELASLDPDQRRKAFADMARTAYAKRRKRGAIFGDPELFGEPAWDILLDLYIAHIEEKAVSVSSACIGSASPPTTGLRWLGVLSEQGFVEREHDPQDQRRVLVRLTERALDAMDEYFSSGVNLYGDRRAARA